MLGEMQNGLMENVHPVTIALKGALLSLQGTNDVQNLPGDGLGSAGQCWCCERGEDVGRIPVFLLDLA